MDEHADDVLPFVKDNRIAEGNYRPCLTEGPSILLCGTNTSRFRGVGKYQRTVGGDKANLEDSGIARSDPHVI